MRHSLPFAGAVLTLAACTALPPALPPPQAPLGSATQSPRSSLEPASSAPLDDDQPVGVTLLPGKAPVLAAGIVASRSVARARANVSLNFPAVDVQLVARAVLTDVLGQPFSISSDLHTPVTLVPGKRIPRSAVLPAFEEALRAAGLALVPQPVGFAILPVEQAKAASPVGATTFGFSSEALQLQYVNADELKRLIDPVLPGVVTSTDASRNLLTIAGTEGQRASARSLVRQFDVNWLRGTSFGLFIPHRTDARLLVPELDKVLNADGAPTRNLVHLIAMDQLNGILAISTQSQYLDDVRRWVEILDREGQSNARRLFVYRVQNGRAADLARVLASAFGQSGAATVSSSGVGAGFDERSRAPGTIGVLSSDASIPSSAPPQGPTFTGSSGQAQASGLSVGQGGGPGLGQAYGNAAASSGSLGDPAIAGAAADIQADNFRARITADNINNALIVYANPRDYAVVEDALRRLDTPPVQVMIEAAITEVTLTDTLRFGVQGLFNNHGTSVGLTESAASAAPIQAFPGFSALYAAKTVSAALNALEQLTTIKVVSAPKLLVLNNQTASIEVGNQVPILTGSATSVITSNAPVVNSVDYRDTGILLKVTPRVNSSGLVSLDLAQEVSDVIAAGTSSTIDSPTISTRRIATSIAVQDGEVIALGGLIRDNRTDAKNGLPVLSRIPILGAVLFGNINNNDTRTELIVLLKPQVVRGVDDGRAVTEDIRAKLASLRALLPARNIP